MYNQHVDKSTITNALKRYFNTVTLGSYEVIHQGGENRTVHAVGNFGNVIIRFYGETHSGIGKRRRTDIEAEIAFMEYCYRMGIPVPKIYVSTTNALYESLDDNHSFYIVLEYIEGRSPENFSPHMTSEVAKTMAKMHTISEDFRFPAPRAWPGTALQIAEIRTQRFLDLPGDSSDLTYTFIKSMALNLRDRASSFDLSTLPAGVIHGDIIWHNMKFVDERLAAIFDFDDCRESYFVEDIAKTILYPFHSPGLSIFGRDGSNVNIFLDSYQSIRTLSDQEKSALPIFFLARAVYDLTVYYPRISGGEPGLGDQLQEYIERYRRFQNYFDASSLEYKA